jgi:hypothetical protein
VSDLRVLKLDHNPIDYPPREIVTFPGSSSPTAAQMSRSQSDRSAGSGQDPRERGDEAKVMQRWLAGLQKFMRENPGQFARARPGLMIDST